MNPTILKDKLRDKILIFDGAMGTMLQKSGLTPQDCPEQLNYLQPQLIKSIHQAYIEAGATFIQSNTFGANRLKLGEFGLSNEVKKINTAGIKLVCEAASDCDREIIVVGDIGPLGKLIAPLGEISFAEAYTIFFEQAQALAEAGADVLAIETMSDLQEIRIALIAARAATQLPIIAQMTFQEDLRTLTGSDPETVVTVLEALGADIVGVNCGSGPENLIPIIERMAQVSGAFLIAQPNAGLPELIQDQTVFKQSPEEIAAYVPALIKAGANIIGGCCGSTPQHIKAIYETARQYKPQLRTKINFSKLASRTKTVYIGADFPTCCIGERINPTARKKLAESIRQMDMRLICNEAQEQVAAGAPILDVNMGVPNIDETAAMIKAILEIQRLTDVPISIDSSNPNTLEAGLQTFVGKPLINSCNGHQESMETILPLAKKYGAAVLGLTLDEKGIPDSAAGRLKIAHTIVEKALQYGIRRENIFIDCLVLTAGAQQAMVMETIKALKMVKEELGVKTMLGVSNVSHGLPNRELINATFLSMALGNGLDLPILNPHSHHMMNAMKAADLLTGRDKNGSCFINYSPRYDSTKGTTDIKQPSQVNPQEETLTSFHPLYETVLNGDKDHIVENIEIALKNNITPMEIMNDFLIPALEEAGRRFEAKVFFLPQLMMAAETMKKAFTRLKSELSLQSDDNRACIVIATVKGDIHDIGKNIVSLMLENHGFKVIDLGKDVPAETIVTTALQQKNCLVGLSALMTTTMMEMKNVCTLLQKADPNIKVMIGGAVVTASFAKEIGAYYAKDAVNAVTLAKQLINL